MAFEDVDVFRQAGRPKPPIPTAVRQAVLKRANGCCEECQTPVAMFSKLELHHLHYDTEGHEREDDLRALCRSCHREAHVDDAGVFWADPQERENFWALYDKQAGE